MNYLPYPTKKNTPSRKTRKGARRDIFLKNKASRKLLKKQKRLQDSEEDA